MSLQKKMNRLPQLFVLPAACLITALCAGLFCFEAQAADQCTYYVDASASADGDGSLATPWNRLWQVDLAMSSFQAGDHICFKRGEVFGFVSPVSTMLAITSLPGTEQEPIVFEAYGDPADPLPVIDGSQSLGDAWIPVPGKANIYSRVRQKQFILPSSLMYYNGTPRPPITTLQFSSLAVPIEKNNILIQKDGVYTTLLVTSASPADKTVSGITRYEMLPDKDVYVRKLVNGVETTSPSIGKPTLKTSGALEGLAEPGHWYWEADQSDPSTGNIFLYTEFDPNSNPVPFSFEGDGIRIVSSQHVVVRDIRVERVSRNGIVLYNSTNIKLEGNTVFGCGLAGVQMWNASDSLIQNNSLDANATGIEMYTEPASGNKTINNTIQQNTVSNCRGACIGLSRDEGSYPGDVSGNLIIGNTITNANTMSYDGAGIYTFFAGANTFQANTIRNCGSANLRSAGIMIDVGGEPMTITGNTIENNSLGGIVLSGADHIVTGNTLRNNGVPSWPSGQVGFFNATTATTPAVASDCTVTGNTIEADEAHHFMTVEAGSSSGHVINYNTYRGQSVQQFLWTTNQWLDFPTWKSTTGFDLNSNYINRSPMMTATYLLLLGN